MDEMTFLHEVYLDRINQIHIIRRPILYVKHDVDNDLIFVLKGDSLGKGKGHDQLYVYNCDVYRSLRDAVISASPYHIFAYGDPDYRRSDYAEAISIGINKYLTLKYKMTFESMCSLKDKVDQCMSLEITAHMNELYKRIGENIQ